MDALLNWLWQGLLPTLALSALVKGCGPALGADRRYRLWWLTLVAVLVSPVLPVWFGSVTIVERATMSAGAPVPLPAAVDASTPILLTIWSATSLVAILRLALSLVGVNRAKRACSPFPPGRELALRHWSDRRGRGTVPLVVSADVGSAAVLGVTSPVIAVNPALLDALEDEELDQIVMHEWAHIERRDHGLNVIQRLILAVFGLHPAVWWIGRQLHIEREAACDDRVVSISGSTKRYAACLLKLGMIASPHGDLLPVPAAVTTPQLTIRIHRLLDARRQSRVHKSRLVGSLGAALVLLTTVVVTNIELVGFAEPMMMSSSAVTSGGGTNSTIATGGGPFEPVRESGASHPPVPESKAVSRGSRQIPSQSANRSSLRALAATSSPALPDTRAAAGPIAAGHDLSGASNVGADPIARIALSRPDPTLLPLIPAIDADHTQRDQTPWGAAADAGVAVGRGSQKAATATAGFFKRMSKSVAGSFRPADTNEPRK